MITALIAALPIFGCVIWLIYDLLVVFYLGPRYHVPTITHDIYTWSFKYPAIPFFTGLILGLLCGHFFLQF